MRALNPASQRRIVIVSACVGAFLCVYPTVFILEATNGVTSFERDVCYAVADVVVKIGVTAVLSRMSILRFSEGLDMSAAVLQHVAREKSRLLGAVRIRIEPQLLKQLNSIEELRRVLAEQEKAVLPPGSGNKSKDPSAQDVSTQKTKITPTSAPGNTRRRAPRSKLLGDRDESEGVVGSTSTSVTGSVMSYTQGASMFLDPKETLDNIFSLALGMSKAMDDVAIYEQATSETLESKIVPVNPQQLYRPIRSRVRGLALRCNITTEFLWLDRDGYVDEVGALTDMRALQYILLTTVHAAV